jgi:putative hydrolase of HD superfamily
LEKLTDADFQDVAKFLGITGILKRTLRTGWVDIEVYQPESVADHSFRTAVLCMVYADIKGLEPLKMLRMALIHDLPEAIIGDLLPHQKTKETKEYEEKAIKRILGLLPETEKEKYLEIWNEYKKGESREAKAVRQLEKIEMAIQAKEYEKMGIDKKRIERFTKSAKDATIWPDLRRLLSFILEET